MARPKSKDPKSETLRFRVTKDQSKLWQECKACFGIGFCVAFVIHSLRELLENERKNQLSIDDK